MREQEKYRKTNEDLNYYYEKLVRLLIINRIYQGKQRRVIFPVIFHHPVNFLPFFFNNIQVIGKQSGIWKR